jgi:hypothetical protein
MTTDKWFGLAPGTSSQIASVYRDAFQKIGIDKEFLTAAAKIKADMRPVNYTDMTKLIWRLADTSAEALHFTKAIMEKQGLHTKQAD